MRAARLRPRALLTRIVGGSLLLHAALVTAPVHATPASAPQAPRPMTRSPPPAHASLAAYPTAVITLHDPASGLRFEVEPDGRHLVATGGDGVLRWRTDVFAAARFTPAAGEPVIRHLRLDQGQLFVTCGKSDEVRIDPRSGAAVYLGAD